MILIFKKANNMKPVNKINLKTEYIKTILFVIILLMFFSIKSQISFATEKEFTIIYSNNVLGEFDPCG